MFKTFRDGKAVFSTKVTNFIKLPGALLPGHVGGELVVESGVTSVVSIPYSLPHFKVWVSFH